MYQPTKKSKRASRRGARRIRKHRSVLDALDDAAKLAARNPGKTVRCGKIAFKVEGDFLFMLLPTGRRMAYPFPTMIRNDRDEEVVWGVIKR